MTVRIYTTLSARDKFKLAARAIKEDRSESKIIARAMAGANPADITTRPPKIEGEAAKVFARVEDDVLENVKEIAAIKGWRDWEVVNACLQNYLHA